VLPPGLEPGLAAYETTEMTCTSLEAYWLAWLDLNQRLTGYQPITLPLSYTPMKSYIYVIGTTNPPYKVGISINPARRLKTLQTGHPEKLQILHITETEITRTKLLETVIHRNLKHYRQTGEWFNITFDQLLLEIEFAMIRYSEDPTLRTMLNNGII